ncbi:hypothetical protein PISMIDRAFT_688663 [Pisolithus microcarpus 441]|uniref:Uncharacterized protein n=1 Tax=Pisolithus microcarpus 441 TaxID=765257 RepID=A0A0C9Z032_9AGAM|nr:hypothetical protein PISMIDRAFT_688663 [Pisolithus microcarpus 441]
MTTILPEGVTRKVSYGQAPTEPSERIQGSHPEARIINLTKPCRDYAHSGLKSKP